MKWKKKQILIGRICRSAFTTKKKRGKNLPVQLNRRFEIRFSMLKNMFVFNINPEFGDCNL